jgi:hypothetical protein
VCSKNGAFLSKVWVLALILSTETPRVYLEQQLRAEMGTNSSVPEEDKTPKEEDAIRSAPQVEEDDDEPDEW